jgi:hypothetical protein
MSKMPPVPPASRSPKGPGAAPQVDVDSSKDESYEGVGRTGDQSNIKQNTTNQGYQQDR